MNCKHEARDSLVKLQLFMEHIGAKQMAVLCGDGSEIYGSDVMEQIATLVSQIDEVLTARKPLTSEELKSIREHQRLLEELGPVWAPMLYYFCRAIEQAHGIGGEE